MEKNNLIMIRTQSWDECFINTSMLAVCPPSVSGCYTTISCRMGLSPLILVPCSLVSLFWFLWLFVSGSLAPLVSSLFLVSWWPCLIVSSLVLCFWFPLFPHISLILYSSLSLLSSCLRVVFFLLLFSSSPQFSVYITHIPLFLINLIRWLVVSSSLLGLFSTYFEVLLIVSPLLPKLEIIPSSLVHLFPFFLPLVFWVSIVSNSLVLVFHSQVSDWWLWSLLLLSGLDDLHWTSLWLWTWITDPRCALIKTLLSWWLWLLVVNANVSFTLTFNIFKLNIFIIKYLLMR